MIFCSWKVQRQRSWPPFGDLLCRQCQCNTIPATSVIIEGNCFNAPPISIVFYWCRDINAFPSSYPNKSMAYPGHTLIYTDIVVQEFLHTTINYFVLLLLARWNWLFNYQCFTLVLPKIINQNKKQKESQSNSINFHTLQF